MPTPPKKNASYTFFVSLISQVNGKVFQNAPTLAGGDVKISIDGGSLNNLSNLPIVTPPASKLVAVTLTAAEMNGDNIIVIFSDQAGNEWCDLVVPIQTSVRQIDDLTYPTYQLPDSVAADGTIPNFEQAILMLTRFLFERVVAGTIVTVNKEDGSTPSMTFTLNNASNPTSITRST